MKIAIGSDHRGIEMRKNVCRIVEEAGHVTADLGCLGPEAVDYPDIAVAVAEAVSRGEYERGILICGTGIGMCIAANKVKGIRAANCHNAFMAYRARLHNDANVLCLAAEEGRAMVPAILETFLETGFEGGRHQLRLDKIKAFEA